MFLWLKRFDDFFLLGVVNQVFIISADNNTFWSFVQRKDMSDRGGSNIKIKHNFTLIAI